MSSQDVAGPGRCRSGIGRAALVGSERRPGMPFQRAVVRDPDERRSARRPRDTWSSGLPWRRGCASAAARRARGRGAACSRMRVRRPARESVHVQRAACQVRQNHRRYLRRIPDQLALGHGSVAARPAAAPAGRPARAPLARASLPGRAPVDVSSRSSRPKTMPRPRVAHLVSSASSSSVGPGTGRGRSSTDASAAGRSDRNPVRVGLHLIVGPAADTDCG